MSEALKRDYTVCEEIGRGRFGVVSRCYSAVSGESFAVKSVEKRLLADDSIDQQCLYNEAKIMQVLAPHPNVIQVYDVYEDEDWLHLVIELCNSPDLFCRVSERVFDESEAKSVMVPLMEAIAHCHRLGVVHRDLKPDNVLFDEWNRLKLADFGSAECVRENEVLTGVVGTPYYVAPEVLAGRNYNEKVDVWSAGVILYVMLTGVAPFYGNSATEIFEAVLRANLRFPVRYFHSVSPAVKDLLRRMLCKDASRRLSAEQVLGEYIQIKAESQNINIYLDSDLIDMTYLDKFTTRLFSPETNKYPIENSLYVSMFFCFVVTLFLVEVRDQFFWIDRFYYTNL